MRNLLMMVGLPDLPLPSIILVVAMIMLAAMLFGWISDLLLGNAGFGTMLNTGLILVGAFAGAWLWHRFGMLTRFDANAVRAAIALVSGLSLLVLAAVFRP